MTQPLIGGAINPSFNTATGGAINTARPPFICSFCGESFRVDYHGRKPPFCPQVVFMEDVFCMRDPFSAGGGGGENVSETTPPESDSAIAPPPQHQRFPFTSVSWLLDTRKDAMKKVS